MKKSTRTAVHLLASAGTLVALVVGLLPAVAHSAEPPRQFLLQFGESGAGAGQLTNARGVATDPNTGHVYVADLGNQRISEFTAWGQFVKAWGWGVADETSTEPQICTETCFKGLKGEGAGEFSNPVGLAVDGSGDVYVADFTNHRVQKFNSAGEFLLMFGGEVNQTTGENVCTKAQLEGGDTCGVGTVGAGLGQFGAWKVGGFIAVAPSGTVFVGDIDRIEEFEPNGTFLTEIALPGEGAVESLTVDGLENVYSHTANSPGVRKMSSSGTVLDVLDNSGVPKAVAVDPSGRTYVVDGASEPTVLEFDASGAELPPFGVGEFTGSTGAGTNAVGDVYVSNFTAGNPYVRAYGPLPTEFEPPPLRAPTVVSQFATSVVTDGATVRAKITPHFWATKYFVEYGLGDCETTSCTQQPAAPGADLGGERDTPILTAGVPLLGLEPGTVYHYRFVASSTGGTTLGPDQTFLTAPAPEPPSANCPNQQFRIGHGAALPDCRAYEMVSPTDKNGGDALAVPGFEERPAGFNEASATGGSLTYSSYRAFGDAPGAPYAAQYLADRGPAGWTSRAISPSRGLTIPVGGVPILASEFKAFSPDLSTAWVWHNSDALTPDAVEGFTNIYKRDNETNAYQALTTVEPPVRTPGRFFPEFQGASADGSRAIFRVEDALTPDAPNLGESESQLYEWSEGGGLRLVSILPNDEPVNEATTAGTANVQVRLGYQQTVAHAISDDGSRIFWSTTGSSGGGPGRLFVRIDGDHTVPVSESVSAENAQFWTASADGAKAVFTIGGEIATSGSDLYVFDVDTEVPTLLAHAVKGVLGASTDLSYLYFVSNEALAAGATEGEANLYVEHNGTPTFIATLSESEGAGVTNGGSFPSVDSAIPIERMSTVTPDGSVVAFLSTRSLTGADNADVDSGAPDAELYRYDAVGEALTCVSCNPSGARPSGRIIREGAVETLSAAATIPFWENQLYDPRSLSDDGNRLFFNSFDALLPQDSNGKEDVYQWEASGTGDCVSASGCLDLISSGDSSQDSEFVDASPSGNDVFFATASSLVSQDPGQVDIYDARIEGGFASPPAAAACEGEGCQPAPAVPGFSAPASSNFAGPGNSKERVRKHRHRRHRHRKHHAKKHRRHAAHRNGGRG